MRFSNSTGPLTWSLSEYPKLEQSKAVRQKIHLSLEIFSDWRCTWCTFSFESDHVHFTSPITPKMQYGERFHCPACRTSLIETRFWVVVICPIIKCLIVLEFSFILFDLCLFITIFNFIFNYVPIVTFWILTYHKIWILLFIFCFIWSYWIIYFLTCLEVFWSVVS